MRSTFVLAALCLLAPLTLAAPKVGAVVAGDSGYFVLPPDIVSGPTVVKSVASDDGHCVLAIREKEYLTANGILRATAAGPQPTKETILVFWDSESRSPKEVWSMTSRSAWVQQFMWMPRSHCGFLEVVDMTESAGEDGGGDQVRDIITVTSTQTKQITFDPDADVHLQISPFAAAAILHVRSVRLGYRTLAAWVIGPSGLPGKRLALPEGLDLINSDWQPNGSPVILIGVAGTRPIERQQWLSVDVRTGALRPFSGKTYAYKPKLAPPSPLTVSLDLLTIRQRETTASTSVAWLAGDVKGPYPRALVSADCEEVWLTPGSGDVMYRHHGALMARRLVKTPREQFLAAERLAEIAELQSHATQIIRALIMYCNDNDDYLPPADNLAASIMPYLKDASLLEGFEYVDLGHVQQSGVDSPADTIIGYIPGPGGRVVAYLDGHVKWKPDN